MIKIQDLIFLAVFAIIFWRRSAKISTLAGLACLVLAMPLFGLKIMLFSAERLTWYAAAFFLYSIILLAIKELKS